MSHNLTIAIPTYNRAAVIECNLRQLLATDLAVDIIVSDNGSPDDTSTILSQFADERLTVNRNDSNLGFTGNMLKLIELAKTDFIYFISDEDIVEIDGMKKVITQIAGMEAEIGVVFTEVSTGDRVMHRYAHNLISDKFNAVSRYAFTHGYMSGLIVNKKFLDVQEFVSSTKDESIILYPHEIFFLQCLSAGGKLLISDAICCKQGQAVESDAYIELKYDRYAARALLMHRYLRVIKRLEFDTIFNQVVLSALARYAAVIFYHNLRSPRLRYSGMLQYLTSVTFSRIGVKFYWHVFSRFVNKIKNSMG